MWKPAIALVLALAATAANAQDTKSEQSQAPAVTNGTRPFLFDGRMRGDGNRQGAAAAADHHSNAGAIVMPPPAPKPNHDR